MIGTRKDVTHVASLPLRSPTKTARAVDSNVLKILPRYNRTCQSSQPNQRTGDSWINSHPMGQDVHTWLCGGGGLMWAPHTVIFPLNYWTFNQNQDLCKTRTLHHHSELRRPLPFIIEICFVFQLMRKNQVLWQSAGSSFEHGSKERNKQACLALSVPGKTAPEKYHKSNCCA